MPKKKTVKPEFYKTFMKEGIFPNSNKITRFEESENYWIFKTGPKIYKVKKKEEVQSSVSLDEIFCNEVVHQIQKNSPSLEAEIFRVFKEGSTYSVDWSKQNQGKALYYMIAMNQLPERGFLQNLIVKNKLNRSTLEKVASHLVSCHKQADISKSKDDGSPENLRSIIENLFYQSKKYLGQTITQAMIDMTFRPLEKYLIDNKKLFLKRIKQEQIKMIHGCYVPRKIHVTKEGVNVLGKTSDPLKNRFNDIASDLADLTVELRLADLKELSEDFINKYCELTEDKDIRQVLPVYQAVKCLTLGLKHSIQFGTQDPADAEASKTSASRYYKQTIEVVRGL